MAPTVVFDLDGTLVETAPDIAAALNAALAPYGVDVATAAVARMIGGGLDALLDRALAAKTLVLSDAERQAAAARLRAAYRAAPAVRSTPHGWVIDAVQVLKRDGFRLAVCTNKAEDIARQVLDAFGLTGWFDAIVGEVPGQPRKPDPAPFRRAVAAAGGQPAHALLVGDSRIDVMTARAAGVPAVLVPHGYGTEAAADLAADRVVADTAALIAAVRALLA